MKIRSAPRISQANECRGHYKTAIYNRVPSFIKVRIVTHKSHKTDIKEAQDNILIQRITGTAPEVNIFKAQAVRT